MRLAPLPKAILIAAVIGGGAYGVYHYKPVPPPPIPSSIPPPVQLPTVGDSTTSTTLTKLTERAPSQPSPTIRFMTWAWSANMGVNKANGGASTAPGSLMAQAGVRMTIIRQDDTAQMQNELRAFAEELAKGNTEPTSGVHFITIMGDQAAAFLSRFQPTLARLCPDCIVKTIGEVGFSYGEDKLMGPAQWKANPQSAKGGVIIGVPLEGDWNIGIKWGADNKLCNNPDETTYDPDCLNWIRADDYVKAGELYINGTSCEDRPTVRQGKRTGETAHICGQAVVTWTPVDVTIAQKRGGLVNVVSTHEYRWQMPAIVIGSHRWMQAHRALVEHMLDAIYQAGAQIKNDPTQLQQAADITAQIYHEQTGAYWAKYYTGVTEADATGQMVELGGSMVNTLDDNLFFFGLLPGSSNLYDLVYTGFGNVAKQQYPARVPSFPPLSEFLDLSYLRALRARKTTADIPDLPKYDAYKPITKVVSKRDWNILFETGKAVLLPDGEKTVQEIFNTIAITGEKVEIHGHTDNTGAKLKNQTLSEARALAVKQRLIQLSPVNFPTSRVNAVGHGSDYPVAANDSESGRQQNRRVEVRIGS